MRRIQSFWMTVKKWGLVALAIVLMLAMFGDWFTTQYLKSNKLSFSEQMPKSCMQR